MTPQKLSTKYDFLIIKPPGNRPIIAFIFNTKDIDTDRPKVKEFRFSCINSPSRLIDHFNSLTDQQCTDIMKTSVHVSFAENALFLDGEENKDFFMSIFNLYRSDLAYTHNVFN